MPIDYTQYHPKWKLISWLIRVRRAKEKCEWCDAPNGQLIYRPFKNSKEWRLWPEGMQSEALTADGFKPVKVVLTVAHIDRNKDNNRFNNLAALCQRCHLKHDIKQHCDNRKYGRNHKGKQQLKIQFSTMEKYYLFDLETETILFDEDGDACQRSSIEELKQMLIDEGYSEDTILTKFAPVQLHNF